MILNILAVMLVSYLIGSIPFGWIIVKLATGRDLRGVESGRTGGTNAWRAAGILAGLLTAILDVIKGRFHRLAGPLADPCYDAFLPLVRDRRSAGRDPWS